MPNHSDIPDFFYLFNPPGCYPAKRAGDIKPKIDSLFVGNVITSMICTLALCPPRAHCSRDFSSPSSLNIWELYALAYSKALQ